MKIPRPKFIQLIVPIFVFFVSLSCSKDTDLLSDYVVSESYEARFVGNLAIRDRFVVVPDDKIVLDVLANDTFIDPNQVEIVKTSDPTNGIVEINEDKTLTYIPNEIASGGQGGVSEQPTQEVDTFTYTTETSDEDGTTTTQEATVSLTIGFGELKAFPTAEGYGKNTSGGRGGQAIHVTNLNDNGPGSLREAVQTSGPRTIVFDVSGYITLEKAIYVYNPDLTIAGQTAPGDGITLRGATLSIRASNVIVRHLRIRPGVSSASANADCINIMANSNNLNIRNVILDHVSTSWSTDENMAVSAPDSFTNNSVKDVTIQNCINAEPLEYYAFLIAQNVSHLTIVRNLFAHAPNRIPESAYRYTEEGYEFCNNIIYNYNRATTMAYGASVDVIGNVYKSKQTPATANITYNLNSIENPNGKPTDGSIHQSDNKQLGNSALGMTNSTWDSNNKSVRVHGNSLYTPIPASDVEEYVLYDVGANVFNDPVDQRIISDYNNNSGVQGPKNESLVGGYTSLTVAQRPNDYDKDGDGMADSWELNHDLDPNNVDDSSADRNNDGYSNLEEFLHFLTL